MHRSTQLFAGEIDGLRSEYAHKRGETTFIEWQITAICKAWSRVEREVGGAYQGRKAIIVERCKQRL